MSDSNDIMVNSINYHQYAIFLYSSNHSSVIYNEGINNDYSIKQINCIDNTFDENSFKILTYSRTVDSDTNDNEYEEKIVDFTILLLFCLFSFVLGIFARKILYQ